jgi:hypothetical protein
MAHTLSCFARNTRLSALKQTMASGCTTQTCHEDSLTTSPGGDVTLGTIMVGAAYFRQQGSFTSLASFDGMGAPPSTGLSPMVMQLLGINRPQVA